MQGKTIGNVSGLGVRSSGDASGLTLVVALRRLGDADAQLAAVGVDAHHGAVGRGAGQRRDLRGVPGDAVQRLGDVGRALQDQVLRNGTGTAQPWKRDLPRGWGWGWTVPPPAA